MEAAPDRKRHAAARPWHRLPRPGAKSRAAATIGILAAAVRTRRWQGCRDILSLLG